MTTNSDRPAPGTITRLGLGTDDADVAARFYGELLGWTFTVPTALGGYRCAQLDGRDVADIFAIDLAALDAIRPAWTVSVEVPSLADALDTATVAGGAVLQPPLDLPGGGRTALLADPADAVLAVIESAPDAGTPPLGEPGGLYWAQAMSTRPGPAAAFYASTFGWEAFDDGADCTTFLLDGVPVAGMLALPPHPTAQMRSHWFVSFSVADLDAALAATREAGGVVRGQPVPIGLGRFAVAEDPRGAGFALVEAALVAARPG